MHNNIMAAGSKDRPPMLGPGRYSQWRSLNSPEVPQHDEAETIHNMSAENKLYFQAEKEAIFLLLTGIGDEIYSTVDACNTANKMWIDIDRLQQGESLNLYKPTNNNLRTSSNSRNKTEDSTPRKPKRVKDYSYHKEKIMMCKQAEHGVPLQAEQADWLADMDEEIDEQELEAHYSFMAKIQEVLPEESSSTEQPLEQ
ncbi:hypothetical protein Tco_0222047, partial [Tanacetum coccineum]